MGGEHIGIRQLELLSRRDKNFSRFENIVDLLEFIQKRIWKNLFGKEADGLEKSSTAETEYFIIDDKPLVNKYIGVPAEFEELNCAAFMGGIIKGVCEASNYPC